MSKYVRAARKAVDRYLRDNSGQEVFRLWDISVVADEAAFAAGKKKELFDSLYEYERVLPHGAKVFWKKTGDFSGVLSVLNPYSYCRQKAPVQEAVLVPGPFDGGVDMGPDAWAEALRTGRGV